MNHTCEQEGRYSHLIELEIDEGISNKKLNK